MDIPKEILEIIKHMQVHHFEAFLVGGCVRDLLLDKEPKDWDIATNAKPSEIQEIFPNSIYENSFGTVVVKTDSDKDNLKLVEITTFRSEGKYTDKRHPDEIKFAKNIEDDLARRDFTVNAMAMDISSNVKCQMSKEAQNPKVIDLYEGQKDIEVKIIRCVGNSDERFNEDALRLIRAVRFAVQLDFSLEENTAISIKKNAKLLGFISKERIRDEFSKIISSRKAKEGVQMLEDLGLLEYIVPELRQGIKCGQNKHHIFDVWEHNLRSLDYTVKKEYPFEIRMAALLHDVGKPQTKRGDGINSTFYGHEVVGANITKKILSRLKFSNEVSEKIVHLVRYHLFYYNVGDVTPAGVRRFLRRVGSENVMDLIKLREADRIGSGVPKAVPYKLRHLLFMVEKVKKDPISPKMLAINGNDLMEKLNLKPSPIIGQILDILLEEVLDNPKKNDREFLLKHASDLSSMSHDELEGLRQKAKNSKDEFEKGEEEEMMEKHHV